MKQFTIGVTTHNEQATINQLLDSLAELPHEVDIILYDDASTDQTKDIVVAHSLATQTNFHAHFSTKNDGVPSVGRTYIGHTATTEYVALFDGDDFLDVDQFKRLIQVAPTGYDLIVTPFTLRGKKAKAPGAAGDLTVNNESVQRIISGIGGKIYRSSLLAKYGPDEFKGRSDDARLNMRILTNERPRIYHLDDVCYYIIHESRKSTRAATLNFDEIRVRVSRYKDIQRIYGVDDRYIMGFRRNLRKVIDGDPDLTKQKRTSLLELIEEIFPSTSTQMPQSMVQRLISKMSFRSQRVRTKS